MAKLGWCASFLLAVAAVVAAGPISVGPTPASSAMPYAVEIELPGSQGSGVIVGNVRIATWGKPVTHSLILTCAHVVVRENSSEPPPDTVDVIHDGKKVTGEVIAVDPKTDLALIEVNEHWTASPILLDSLRVGERDIAVGFPLGSHVTITDGYVGEVDGELLPDKRKIRQESASMWPGNSGGGVFVDRSGWKLAGIAEILRTIPGGLFSQGQIANTVGYFIPVEDIRLFLENVHIR